MMQVMQMLQTLLSSLMNMINNTQTPPEQPEDDTQSAPQLGDPQPQAPQSADSAQTADSTQSDESPETVSTNSAEKVSDFMKPDSDEEFEPSGADFDAVNDVMWVAGDQGELRAYNRDGSYTASEITGEDFDEPTGILTMLDTIENEGGGEHTNWQTTAQLSGTTLSGLTDKSVLEGQTGQLEGLANMGDGSRFFADDQGSMFFGKANR